MSVKHATRISALLLGALQLLTGCDRKPVSIPPPADAVQVLQPPPAAETKQEQPPRAEPAEGEGFSFPADRGGQALARLLPPPEKHFRARAESQPQLRLPGLQGIENPSLALPTGPSELPRLPGPGGRIVRPRPLSDESLAAGSRQLSLPAVQQLPTGAGVRLPIIDVNQPPPLPLLGQPLPDRASLDDPTSLASQTAAISASAAERERPALFLRLVLPDPFENRRTFRGATPDEDPHPPAGPARLPR